MLNGKLSAEHIRDVIEQVVASNAKGLLGVTIFRLVHQEKEGRSPNRLQKMEHETVMHFCSILQEANALGVLGKFLDRVRYLLEWGGNDEMEYQLSLFPDFAKNSMTFRIESREKLHPGNGWHHVLNGGVIYWSPQEPLLDNYSHTGPNDEPYWSIHT